MCSVLQGKTQEGVFISQFSLGRTFTFDVMMNGTLKDTLVHNSSPANFLDKIYVSTATNKTLFLS